MHFMPNELCNDRFETAAQTPLVDPYGRGVEYLRLSVTDRCDLRCVYCMAENMVFLPKKEMLTLEELDRLCASFIGLGVRKIRLTGGEPLVRRNVLWLIEQLGRHLESKTLDEVTLTTNGTQLVKYASALYEAGVRRINVSLDSLKPEKFQKITRWGEIDKVFAGIEAAQKAGLRVKINTVALKNVNQEELFDIVAWCAAQDLDLTFIEVMPMGALTAESDANMRFDQFWSLADLRTELESRYEIQDVPIRSAGPANYVRLRESGQKIGFITPMSHNFCESCNRVRITCTGRLYLCLGQEDSVDLRRPLRLSESNALLEQEIRQAIMQKPKGHDFIIEAEKDRPSVPRHMNVTGG